MRALLLQKRLQKSQNLDSELEQSTSPPPGKCNARKNCGYANPFSSGHSLFSGKVIGIGGRSFFAVFVPLWTETVRNACYSYQYLNVPTASIESRKGKAKSVLRYDGMYPSKISAGRSCLLVSSVRLQLYRGQRAS